LAAAHSISFAGFKQMRRARDILSDRHGLATAAGLPGVVILPDPGQNEFRCFAGLAGTKARRA
jgi:hypothetical protein